MGQSYAEPEGMLLGRMGGWALVPSWVGLHASLGTEPAFLRKAKLPKQINQSVKNLLSQPRSSKRELFLGMKKETADTFGSSLPTGAPPRSLPHPTTCPHWAPAMGQPRGNHHVLPPARGRAKLPV